MIKELKEKILNGYRITFKEAIALSKVENKEELYEHANELRKHFCGNDFDLCSITNAKSGRCSEDCKWCSQSAHYKALVEEYDMVDVNTAVDMAVNSATKGVKRHSLVTSGRTVSERTLEKLLFVYEKIKEKTDIQLCASMGLLSKEQLLKLRLAGVKKYHCNLETAPSFFSNLVRTHTIEEKIETIKAAQEVGMEVCSGGIMGMGESMEQRIEMAFLLRDLNIDSIPINILNPMPGTPLEKAKPLSEEEILTTIAVYRYISPEAWLRFAGGRMQIKSFQHKALKAGINAAITGDYLTSTGANINDDLVEFRKVGYSV